MPAYRFAPNGERMDNITDWALRLFEKNYGKPDVLNAKRSATIGDNDAADAPTRKGAKQTDVIRKLTKESIFHYVYAVLHDPVYREIYSLNLRREFPRIPFYSDFWRWSDWGKKLMALHVGFDSIEPWLLQRVDLPPRNGAARPRPKVLLRADKAKGVVDVDSDTSLRDIPQAAWDYKLGNRSALEWALDQHKERKPKDPVIGASFNTYRFATFKEDVIALIARVVRVSVETVQITEEMRFTKR